VKWGGRWVCATRRACNSCTTIPSTAPRLNALIRGQQDGAMTQGILLLDKPQGLSSSAAVQRVRRAFGRVKAGHTGSLDPLATGMLPICLGEATKVAGYLLDGDKCYEFTARFGARTATGDLEGPVVETAPVPADLAAALRGVIPGFTGSIEQIPPMYWR
jgi:tRNA pseudouridine55 synthase